MYEPPYSETLRAERRLRDWYFRTLRKCRGDYHREHPVKGIKNFDQWFEDQYGVKVLYYDDGMIQPGYKVTDDEKYVIFLLKYA